MNRPSAPVPRRPSSVSRTVLLAAAALAVAGCKPAPTQHGGFPPAPVSVIEVVPAAVPATYEYTGVTAGSREVEVRARVTGILLKRNYVEGSRVAAGQSLFSIDPVPFQTTLVRLEAELAGAEARLAQAKRTAARLKPLLEARATSQKEYDDAVSAESIAEADVKTARARIAEARLNLDYTRVAAPIAGIAGRAARSEGTLVSGPDVLLTTVLQTDPMYVLFGVSDTDRQRLEREVEAGRLVLPKNGGFEVSIRFPDGGSYAGRGRLNFTDVRVSGSTATGEVRAEFPNAAGALRPGQHVRVVLKGGMRPNAIVIPQRAVLEGPKGKFVYLLTADSKAEARPVEVGDWAADGWIINAGLKPGEKVIVDGVMKIGPGAPVQVGPPPGAPGAADGKGGPPPAGKGAPPAAPAGKQ